MKGENLLLVGDKEGCSLLLFLVYCQKMIKGMSIPCPNIPFLFVCLRDNYWVRGNKFLITLFGGNQLLYLKCNCHCNAMDNSHVMPLSCRYSDAIIFLLKNNAEVELLITCCTPSPSLHCCALCIYVNCA